MACISNQNHNRVFHPNNLLNSSNNLVLKSHHFLFFPSSINSRLTSSIHLRPSFCGSPFNLTRSFPRCHAGTSGPPPPPPGNEIQTKGIGFTLIANHLEGLGITASFSRFRDQLQIFIAVFIWMSLFFWASASDRNNIGGTPKGGRFRK